MEIRHGETMSAVFDGLIPKENAVLDHSALRSAISCVTRPLEESKSVRTKSWFGYSFGVHHAINDFAVQCSRCMKWRCIPSKQKYEEIRQSILEKPFFCSHVSAWRPSTSCDDPSDVSQDEDSLLWAIDKPNIPLAPNGWERLVITRAAGASKFADVYYVAPSGKKVRSMPEVERLLSEHPEYVKAGVNTSQFSFMIPKPLDKDYFRMETVEPKSQKRKHCKQEESQSRKKLKVRKKSSLQQDTEGPSGKKRSKCPGRSRKSFTGLVQMPLGTFQGTGVAPSRPPGRTNDSSLIRTQLEDKKSDNDAESRKT